MKTCGKCKIEKPKIDFNKQSDKKDGMQSQCKDCVREYAKYNAGKIAERKREYAKENAEKISDRQREYRQANQERIAEYKRIHAKANTGKIAEYRREYNKANQEKIASRQREYNKANAEKIAESWREYRKVNNEKIAKWQKEYSVANADKYRARTSEWVKANPERHAANCRNRRSRERSAVGRHTAANIRTIFKSQRGICANCKTNLSTSGKQKYHVDHIMPLSKGGSNWPSNLQCLCPACNLRKNAKDPIKWANENGKLL